jgi:hypothetical protein
VRSPVQIRAPRLLQAPQLLRGFFVLERLCVGAEINRQVGGMARKGPL